jgi:hypothetical protein
LIVYADCYCCSYKPTNQPTNQPTLLTSQKSEDHDYAAAEAEAEAWQLAQCNRIYVRENDLNIRMTILKNMRMVWCIVQFSIALSGRLFSAKNISWFME